MEEIVVYQASGFKCCLEQESTGLLHMHNEVELLYLRSGVVSVRHGGEIYTMQPDDFLLVFPNVVHSVKVVEAAEYLSCRVNMHLFMGLVKLLWQHTIQGAPVLPLCKLHDEVAFCVEQLCTRPELWSETVVTKCYLTIVLKNLLDTFSLVQIHQEAKAEWIGEAIVYLNNHFKQTVTLDEMAKELGVSKYHLSRNFNTQIGCSIPDYLTELRIAKAQRMLERFDDSMVSIMYDCGFESQSTFFRAFKNVTGVTPKKYRAMMKEKIVTSESPQYLE